MFHCLMVLIVPAINPLSFLPLFFCIFYCVFYVLQLLRFFSLPLVLAKVIIMYLCVVFLIFLVHEVYWASWIALNLEIIIISYHYSLYLIHYHYFFKYFPSFTPLLHGDCTYMHLKLFHKRKQFILMCLQVC